MATTDAAWQAATSTGDGSTQARPCTQLCGTQRSCLRSLRKSDLWHYTAIFMDTAEERMPSSTATAPQMNQIRPESSLSWCLSSLNQTFPMTIQDSTPAEQKNKPQELLCGEILGPSIPTSTPWKHLSVDQSPSSSNHIEASRRHQPHQSSITISTRRITSNLGKTSARRSCFTELLAKLRWAFKTSNTRSSNITLRRKQS